MLPLMLRDEIPDLKPWGGPEKLGGETLEGDVQIFGKTIFGEGRGQLSGGWFSASRGRYRLIYPFHEHGTLAEGELVLTNEKTGETVAYRPGDSWLIEKGEQIVWDVKSERAVKHYLVSFQEL
ncbi:MAG: cupin domain-containing protein [Phenylobacterium sp.]|uniref:cupin domain-containing protein n=1 Tax=Phenylobacterium sp. TaxID=1871053 RepID=UPI00391DE0FE